MKKVYLVKKTILCEYGSWSLISKVSHLKEEVEEYIRVQPVLKYIEYSILEKNLCE